MNSIIQHTAEAEHQVYTTWLSVTDTVCPAVLTQRLGATLKYSRANKTAAVSLRHETHLQACEAACLYDVGCTVEAGGHHAVPVGVHGAAV